MVLAERAARLQAEAAAANAQADLSSIEALIGRLKLEIEKLRRQLFGSRSEKARLLEQMELQLAELEATATEDELAAEKAAAKTQTVQSFQRKRPSGKPFPGPSAARAHRDPGARQLSLLWFGQAVKAWRNITETLEVVPRQWKVIQPVREMFSCRACETITQPPGPFHVTPRGFAGPNLLAMILFEKFGQDQPLTGRASDTGAKASISVSRRWPTWSVLARRCCSRCTR